MTESTTEGVEPVEREVVDERTHRQMGAKAQEVVYRRGDEERRKIAVLRKVSRTYGALDGTEPETSERWEKVAEFSEQASTETLFALAELHGYEIASNTPRCRCNST